MIDVSSWTAGRPERCRSPSATVPPARYRPRHNLTVGRLTPTNRPISTLLRPSAANNKIRARCARPAEIDDARVHSRRICSSPACNTNASTRDMIHYFKHRPENQFRHATLGPDGELAHIGGWAGKVVGAAVRIAGLLHLIEHGTTMNLITADSMSSAVALGEYF